MQKPAETSLPLLEAIQQRWSPMGFSAQRIAPELLGSLFEAARWAPSSFGEQPWCFCVATQDQPTEFAAMLKCLNEKNQIWARHAWALCLSCAQRDIARNQQPNRFAFHDVGMATQSLMLQAVSHGIYCHPMGGYDQQLARETLGVPASHDPVAMIAIGYPSADVSHLPEDLQQRQHATRSRKPLTDFVFTGHWGKFAGPFR